MTFKITVQLIANLFLNKRLAILRQVVLLKQSDSGCHYSVIRTRIQVVLYNYNHSPVIPPELWGRNLQRLRRRDSEAIPGMHQSGDSEKKHASHGLRPSALQAIPTKQRVSHPLAASPPR